MFHPRTGAATLGIVAKHPSKQVSRSLERASPPLSEHALGRVQPNRFLADEPTARTELPRGSLRSRFAMPLPALSHHACAISADSPRTNSAAVRASSRVSPAVSSRNVIFVCSRVTLQASAAGDVWIAADMTQHSDGRLVQWIFAKGGRPLCPGSAGCGKWNGRSVCTFMPVAAPGGGWPPAKGNVHEENRVDDLLGSNDVHRRGSGCGLAISTIGDGGACVGASNR